MSYAVVFEKTKVISHNLFRSIVCQGWVTYNNPSTTTWSAYTSVFYSAYTELQTLPAGTYTISADVPEDVTTRLYFYNLDNTKNHILPVSAPGTLPMTFTISEPMKLSIGFGYGENWDDWGYTGTKQVIWTDDIKDVRICEGSSNIPDEYIEELSILRPEEINGDCEISKTVNSKSSLTLSIYPDFECWQFCESQITFFKLINLNPSKRGIELYGRVSAVDSSLDNSGSLHQEVTCVSALDFLSDTNAGNWAIAYDTAMSDFITEFVRRHNNNIGNDSRRTFTAGTVMTANLYEFSANYVSRFDLLKKALTEDNVQSYRSAEFQERYQNGQLYLDVAEKFGTRKSTAIRIKDNLVDIKVNNSVGDGLVTQIYAVGGTNYDGSRSAVTARNDALASKYGVIELCLQNEKIYAAGPEAWNECTANLLSWAQQQAKLLEDPLITIALNAEDLQAIGFTEYDELDLGNYYPVICPQLKICDEMRITGIKRKLANPAIVSIVIEKGQKRPSSKKLGTTTVWTSLEELNKKIQEESQKNSDFTDQKINETTDGAGMKQMTQEEYDALLEKLNNLLYLVEQEDGSVELYIGDNHISSEGGGGGTIELATVLSEEQLTTWAPDHELVPVSFRGSATVYYGQAPSRFVLQGQRMCYGVTTLLPSDVLSELTLEFFDGSRQKAKIFLAGMTLTTVTLGVEIYDISGAANILIGRGTAAAAFSLPSSFNSMQIGIVHWCNGFIQRDGNLVPSGGVSLALLIDGVQVTDPSGIASRFPSVTGSYFNDSVADHVQRKWASDAEMYFAEALSRKTEPSVDEPEEQENASVGGGNE